MNTDMKVAVVYNAYAEGAVAAAERTSEEAVTGMAREVFDCLSGLGLRTALIALENDLTAFTGRVREFAPDVLVNLCEGFNGRPELESAVAGTFELLGYGFTGSGSRTLALCQDKYRTKTLLADAGLPTAPARLADTPDAGTGLGFPLMVKPNSEDASLGIYGDSVVRDEAGLRDRISRILETYGQPALVEKFLEGREFNVAVFENGKVRALPVSEIDYSALPEGVPHVLGYEAKWFEDHPLCIQTPAVCPAPLDGPAGEELQALAVKAFKVMGCRDYARIDFRMDGAGRPFILEVNPNPDISGGAGYARALKAAGIAYPDFWLALVGNAARRNGGAK